MKLHHSVARVALTALMAVAMATATLAEAPVRDSTLQVGAQTFRYLSAGTDGRAIVLLHGWPQTADEFAAIIPDLAEDHRVYAPDLSGIGGTDAPGQRWDKAALAADIKGFVDALELEDPLIVGHDIGGMVAYAYGRQYPDAVSGIAILDVPIPGLDPADAIAASPYAWHYDFHKQAGLAEALIDGRQADYFRYFIDSNAANAEAISDADIARYAEAYGSPESLRAGFELYRAFEDDAVFVRGHDSSFAVPMLVVGGEFSTGAVLPVMEQSFVAQGATDIETLAIAGAGHWLAEEQPAATADAIRTFAASLVGR
jgi:pimeloyl-ACP methyl ester carboxylesterase